MLACAAFWDKRAGIKSKCEDHGEIPFSSSGYLLPEMSESFFSNIPITSEFKTWWVYLNTCALRFFAETSEPEESPSLLLSFFLYQGDTYSLNILRPHLGSK